MKFLFTKSETEAITESKKASKSFVTMQYLDRDAYKLANLAPQLLELIKRMEVQYELVARAGHTLATEKQAATRKANTMRHLNHPNNH